MIVAVAVTFFLISYLILNKLLRYWLSKRYCAELLGEQSNLTSSLPARLSVAVLPGSRVFRSLVLPIPGKDGEEIRLGTVVVSRSGIFIICQINGGGILENPQNGRWKHICGGKCAEYENPFALQKDARELIDYYTELAGISDVRSHSMIIYTDPHLKFTNARSRGVIAAEELPKRLSQLEKRGKLSYSQVRAVCSMLRNVDSY